MAMKAMMTSFLVDMEWVGGDQYGYCRVLVARVEGIRSLVHSNSVSGLNSYHHDP